MDRFEKFAFLLFWLFFAIFGIPNFIPLVAGQYGWMMMIVIILIAILVPIAVIKTKK